MGRLLLQAEGSGAIEKLVDDDDLDFVHPPRRTTIGAESEPYGPATVEVRLAERRHRRDVVHGNGESLLGDRAGARHGSTSTDHGKRRRVGKGRTLGLGPATEGVEKARQPLSQQISHPAGSDGCPVRPVHFRRARRLRARREEALEGKQQQREVARGAGHGCGPQRTCGWSSRPATTSTRRGRCSASRGRSGDERRRLVLHATSSRIGIC